ncbi:MAG: DUF2851 family protein [Bacteroidales bacterium]|nr:DUF2851 family protein [Bacteroidales bacterium]MCF8456016.1 DUF2851 family protein [Bacteroidales bacterium]
MFNKQFQTVTEEFLQFLWKYGYYTKDSLESTKGERVEVLKPGEWNSHAGPDFFNAQVRIGDTLWAGNVEIHLQSSDWIKHGHTSDKAYSNVILHVVQQNDISIKNSDGQEIPTVELKYDPAYGSRYHQLMQNRMWVACERFLPAINKFETHFWLGKLAIERLGAKSESILHSLEETTGNWEEAFYIHIARSFGLKENAQAFEMMAKSLPLKILAKHKNQLFQIEALLFGQAGMLTQMKEENEYYESLRKEYLFLRKKYDLQPLQVHLWKHMRMRPSNFPEVRLAQFAALIYKSSALFSKTLDAKGVSSLRDLLQLTASEYWDTHYRFDHPARKMKKQLGTGTIDSILINTIIPSIFVYGSQKGLEEFKDRAIALLESMNAESNSVVKRWNELGIDIPNAFYSQAVIQLKREYCEKLRCLNCRIGNEIITAK